MLQYVINLSSIWLVSLIVFDIFLKNETYHNYNRLFLNSVLLLGIFLPLWSWQQDSIIYAADLSKNVATQASEIKEQIVNTSNPLVIDWQTWLTGIYIVGAAIMFFFLMKELYAILALLKNGKRTAHGKWTIIETNKPISPFSAFGHIFINNIGNYSQEELSIILTHEKKHLQLLHLLDLLLINIAKIIFWFNPLIYLLEKRLLLVHEYQADASVKEDKYRYGEFLVEQSILKSAPILSHSFIRSPLKSRIKMLTKQSKKIAGLKQLIIAPLLLFTMLCFTESSLLFAQEKKVEGNNVYYKGNVFEKVISKVDTTLVYEQYTGEEQMVLTTRDNPITKMNGEPIINQYYRNSEIPANYKAIIDKIRNDVNNNIKNEVEKIKRFDNEKFRYNIEHLVIDKNGNAVYYELSATQYIRPKSGDQYEVPEDIRKAVSRKITAVLKELKAPVIYNDGKPTPYVVYVSDQLSIM